MKLPTRKKQTYKEFVHNKSQLAGDFGFKPVFVPDFLFDFQKSLLEWSCLKGRSATFADCGLGKTPLELAWCQNVVQKTNGRTLILAPLGVTGQHKAEADKFGIEAEISRDGSLNSKIIITNYERLHYFNWQDFDGVACDESSVLKNYDGVIKSAITDFMRKIKYRSLYTATAAPNDYIELGTSSEALGYLGYIDMLKMFFKADGNTYAIGGAAKGGRRFNPDQFQGKFRFRGHAEHDFWRWVCGWSRAIRKPSDLGFDDSKFKLPKLILKQHTVKRLKPLDGMLFTLPVRGLKEERQERRETLQERCETAASLCPDWDYTVSWCNLNTESDLLEKLIPDSVQVKGSDDIDKKEEALNAFRNKQIKNLVTKADIAGFGSNWQHCNHQTYFPSHSFEQYYQGIRRCWRFGQKRNVTIDIVTSEGELNVLKNLQRKAANAERMFDSLVNLMNNELNLKTENQYTKKEKLPSW